MLSTSESFAAISSLLPEGTETSTMHDAPNKLTSTQNFTAGLN